MVEIPFVKPNQLEIARAMEDFVLTLPESVVTFAGVFVERTPLGVEPTFYVSVGCPPNTPLEACSIAVFTHLRKQWKTEKIDIRAFWGRIRTN